MFLFKNNVDLLIECGLFENTIKIIFVWSFKSILLNETKKLSILLKMKNQFSNKFSINVWKTILQRFLNMLDMNVCHN